MDLIYEYSADLTENLTDLESKQDKIKLIQKYIRQIVHAKVQPVPDLREGIEWFNVAKELSLRKHLSNKLVLLDFFTYCCINCLHVLPELKKIERKYTITDGLVVVGIHSAKFEAEKLSENVGAAVLRHEIQHPVANDGMVLWNEMEIACWPSLVLLGPGNIPLFILMGEGHTETLNLMIEAALEHFGDQISKAPVSQIAPNSHVAPSSGLLFPGRVAVLGGKLLIADSGHHRVLLVDSASGQVVAKIGSGDSGLIDGNFEEARFHFPQGVIFLDENTAFVADTENNALRMIDFQKKTVTTISGNGELGSDRVGGVVPATEQSLCSPWGLAFDRTKKILLIAMAGSHQIWGFALDNATIWTKSLTKGVCLALAGSGREENRNNSYPLMAAFAQPSGIALCGANGDSLLLADSESSSIRKIQMDSGAVSGVVGGEKNPANLFAFGDNGGKGTEAKLQHPLDVCWSAKMGKALAVDTFNSNVKIIDIASNSCEIAKLDVGAKNLKEPGGICSDDVSGKLFIADTNNHIIQTIDTNTWELSEFPLLFASEVDSCPSGPSHCEQSAVVSSSGAVINISVSVAFTKKLKASEDAPQTWQLTLPDGIVCEPSRGKLSIENECRHLSASMKLEVAASAEMTSDAAILLKIVSCGEGQCKMETLRAILKIKLIEGGPTSVDTSFSLEI